MRVLGMTVRLVLAALLAIFAVPAAWDLLVWVVQARQRLPPVPWAIASGVVLGGLVSAWRKPDWLLHTLIHETCHAVTCVVLRVKVRSFAATDGKGGQVEHDACDPLRETFIAIAPYTLPLLLLPALVGRYFTTGSTGQAIMSAVVGFLLVTHLVGLVRNVRTNFWGAEGDLAKVGRPLSLVLIALALLLTLTGSLVAWWA
jgi:hypothetical protein